MAGHRRSREVLGAATVLLALLLPSALTLPPMNLMPDDDMKFQYCDEFDLGAGLPIKYVTLEDSLVFLLNATDSLLHLRLMVEDTLFKATVSGNYIKMQKCDLAETTCAITSEGGSKSSDIITAGASNIINVTHLNNEVKVEVNMRANVVGMTMPEHVGSEAKFEVAIVNVDPHSQMFHDPDYSGHVKILCTDSGAAPAIRQMDPLPMPTTRTPIFTTSLFPSYLPPPNKNCPVVNVEVNHPFNFPMISDSFTMAVLPSSPSLELTIDLPNVTYQLSVEGRRMELLKCTTATKHCVTEDSNNFQQNLLGVGEWTNVTIRVTSMGVHINLSNGFTIMSQSRIGDTSSILVTVLPALPTGKAEHYSVIVNPQCHGTTDFPGQFTVTMGPITIPAITTTEAYNTTSGPEASTGTDPRTIGIIIGVLLAVLLVVVVAFVISTYNKRRSATINQHTPLNEQQQKQ